MSLLEHFKPQLFAYVLFAGGSASYFIFSLLPVIPIDFPFSATAGLFFVFVSVSGFASVWVSKDKFSAIYAYFLILQIVISIVLIGVAGTTIKKDELLKDMAKRAQEQIRNGDTSFFHEFNRNFKCCIFHDAYHKPPPPPEPTSPPIDPDNESNSFRFSYTDLALKIEFPPGFKIPLSCCPELNDEGKCTEELVYKQTCDKGVDIVFATYKITSIVLLSAAVVFQSLLLFSFTKQYKHN